MDFEHGIQARRRRAFRETTDDNHPFPPAPDSLDREFTAAAPNRVGRSGASPGLAAPTYIATGQGWATGQG